ncbi:MAG: hypothetical protein JWR61_4916 [Ferruginibacter sp.]|nr:hypothetical protein [Ferruginibacter sp.]
MVIVYSWTTKVGNRPYKIEIVIFCKNSTLSKPTLNFKIDTAIAF